MNPSHIRDVVIVGGGTAGWMTAAALAKVLTGPWNITLVESEEIGIVGVGEATIPLINIYNNALEIDENEFMRETSATFKLGIEFLNWGAQGDSYVHGFGPLGPDIGITKFHQYWLKLRQSGEASELENYSINMRAAKANKFMRARKDMATRHWPKSRTPTTSTPRCTPPTCGAMPRRARCAASRARSPARRHGPTTVMSTRWCWRTASASAATCSSIARAFAAC